MPLSVVLSNLRQGSSHLSRSPAGRDNLTGQVLIRLWPGPASNVITTALPTSSPKASVTFPARATSSCAGLRAGARGSAAGSREAPRRVVGWPAQRRGLRTMQAIIATSRRHLKEGEAVGQSRSPT